MPSENLKIQSNSANFNSHAEKTINTKTKAIPTTQEVAEQLGKKSIKNIENRNLRKTIGSFILGAAGILAVVGPAILGGVMIAGLLSNPVGWAVLGALTIATLVTGLALAAANKGKAWQDIGQPLLIGIGIGVAVVVIVVAIIGAICAAAAMSDMSFSGGGGGGAGGSFGGVTGTISLDVSLGTTILQMEGVESLGRLITTSSSKEISSFTSKGNNNILLESELDKELNSIFEVKPEDKTEQIVKILKDPNSEEPEEQIEAFKKTYLHRRQEKIEINHLDAVILFKIQNLLIEKNEVDKARLIHGFVLSKLSTNSDALLNYKYLSKKNEESWRKADLEKANRIIKNSSSVTDEERLWILKFGAINEWHKYKPSSKIALDNIYNELIKNAEVNLKAKELLLDWYWTQIKSGNSKDNPYQLYEDIAEKYIQEIKEPQEPINNPMYTRILSRTAYCQYKLGDKAKALESISKLCDTPSDYQNQAKFFKAWILASRKTNEDLNQENIIKEFDDAELIINELRSNGYNGVTKMDDLIQYINLYRSSIQKDQGAINELIHRLTKGQGCDRNDNLAKEWNARLLAINSGESVHQKSKKNRSRQPDSIYVGSAYKAVYMFGNELFDKLNISSNINKMSDAISSQSFLKMNKSELDEDIKTILNSLTNGGSEGKIKELVQSYLQRRENKIDIDQNDVKIFQELQDLLINNNEVEKARLIHGFILSKLQINKNEYFNYKNLCKKNEEIWMKTDLNRVNQIAKNHPNLNEEEMFFLLKIFNTDEKYFSDKKLREVYNSIYNKLFTEAETNSKVKDILINYLWFSYLFARTSNDIENSLRGLNKLSPVLDQSNPIISLKKCLILNQIGHNPQALREIEPFCKDNARFQNEAKFLKAVILSTQYIRNKRPKGEIIEDLDQAERILNELKTNDVENDFEVDKIINYINLSRRALHSDPEAISSLIDCLKNGEGCLKNRGLADEWNNKLMNLKNFSQIQKISISERGINSAQNAAVMFSNYDLNIYDAMFLIKELSSQSKNNFSVVELNQIINENLRLIQALGIKNCDIQIGNKIDIWDVRLLLAIQKKLILAGHQDQARLLHGFIIARLSVNYGDNSELKFYKKVMKKYEKKWQELDQLKLNEILHSYPKISNQDKFWALKNLLNNNNYIDPIDLENREKILESFLETENPDQELIGLRAQYYWILIMKNKDSEEESFYINYINSVNALDTTTPKISYQLAYCYYKLGNISKALESINVCCNEENEFQSQAKFLKALILSTVGDQNSESDEKVLEQLNESESLLHELDDREFSNPYFAFNDRIEYINYYKRAIQGDPHAMQSLITRLLSGKGCKQSKELANKWMERLNEKKRAPNS